MNSNSNYKMLSPADKFAVSKYIEGKSISMLDLSNISQENITWATDAMRQIDRADSGLLFHRIRECDAEANERQSRFGTM